MAGKSLQQMMPDAWPVFFRHRQPRPLQVEAMPSILRGESILLSGPTASGKTECVVAPLWQRHVSFRRPQLSVVYIAPTKALVNDLFCRLDTYLGSKYEGVIQRYTGDHHDFKEPKCGFLLLTTPEALDSLQLMHPDKLTGVRAVVVDEIHLLHGNARGQQLRHVLNRIEHNSAPPMHPKDNFQRIGMTATIDDMDVVGQRWLGPEAYSIAIREQREIDLAVLDLDLQSSKEKAVQAAAVIYAWLDQQTPRKVIVFGNTRNGTHEAASALHERLKGTRWPVHWHTGILAKGERERIEDAMRSDRFGVCVATSTIEVGIDIGDIDAVILYDPPYSVGSFLQRIGRGNRKTDLCHVVALCCDEQEKLLIRALYHCARRGVLDDNHDFDRPSVRFQQVLSFAWKGISRDKKPLGLRTIARITCDDQNDEVVDDMLDTGALRAVGDALVPSDYFMDLGERRLIHTIIAGEVRMQIADGASGIPLIDVPSKYFRGEAGKMFVGGRVKQFSTSSAGEVSLENTGRRSRKELVQLPARRGKRLLSRKVVWAIAKLTGVDPRQWHYSRGRIMTWGGEYNRLLALLIKMNCALSHDNISMNEYSVHSLYKLPKFIPQEVLEWSFSLEKNKNITKDNVLPFCEKTRYFQNLSDAMQQEEAFRAIPFQGFRKWLGECVVEGL